MPKAQEWLDKNYPSKTRTQGRKITSINISNQQLEGKLELSWDDFPNLEELDCSNNLITEIGFISQVKSSNSKKQRIEWKLKKINFSNNNFFKQDLTFLTELTELEELFIANNKFIGSLEPLKNMTNLRKLDILGTDINIGLEYLPTSLEKSCYLAIKESLKKHQIDQISKLFVAVEENEIVKVTNVIEELGSNFNPDICCDEKNKFTLLHMAVARNYPEIAELLLEKGADPNIKDCEGNTPLHFAAEENNLSLLKLLSKKGGNINAVNNYGWSILHSAASGVINEKEDWEIIKWLLWQGVTRDSSEEKDGLTVRQVFLQKDYFYAKIYDNLLDEVPKIYYHQQQK